MPEGKIIQFSPDEYPELGPMMGREVRFEGMGIVTPQGLKIQSIDFDLENAADKELKTMTQKYSEPQEDEGPSDF